MSGEVVMGPPVALAAVAGIIVLPTSLAFSLINSVVDKYVEDARREAESKRQRVTAWQAELDEQDRRMRDWNKAVADIQAKADTLISGGLNTSSARNQIERSHITGRPAFRHNSGKTDHTAVKVAVSRCINEIAVQLESLPREFVEDPQSPVRVLRDYVAALRRKLECSQVIAPEELQSFSKTITRTSTSYMERLYRKEEQHAAFRERLQNLFDGILFCLGLESGTDEQAELYHLRANVALLAEARTLEHDKIALMERRCKELHDSVEVQVKARATRKVLADRVTHHLSGMGYIMVSDFIQAPRSRLLKAEMRVPGGALLQIAMQPNNSLSFEVVPEKEQDRQSVMNTFRVKERHWCKDAHTLLNCLNEDGFVYSITLERQVAETAIKVVRTITPEEILGGEKERHEDNLPEEGPSEDISLDETDEEEQMRRFGEQNRRYQ